MDLSPRGFFKASIRPLKPREYKQGPSNGRTGNNDWTRRLPPFLSQIGHVTAPVYKKGASAIGHRQNQSGFNFDKDANEQSERRKKLAAMIQIGKKKNHGPSGDCIKRSVSSESIIHLYQNGKSSSTKVPRLSSDDDRNQIKEHQEREHQILQQEQEQQILQLKQQQQQREQQIIQLKQHLSYAQHAGPVSSLVVTSLPANHYGDELRHDPHGFGQIYKEVMRNVSGFSADLNRQQCSEECEFCDIYRQVHQPLNVSDSSADLNRQQCSDGCDFCDI